MFRYELYYSSTNGMLTTSRISLGNICRSPMGEAVLKDIAKKRGVDIVVDSCGTASYHVGESPDERYVFYVSEASIYTFFITRTVAVCTKVHFFIVTFNH